MIVSNQSISIYSILCEAAIGSIVFILLEVSMPLIYLDLPFLSIRVNSKRLSLLIVIE